MNSSEQHNRNVIYSKIKYKRTKYGRNAGTKHKRKKLWLWGIIAVAFLLVLWGVAAERYARYLPTYPQVDITEYLDQKNLSDEDYIVLFRQTGLARPAVDVLRKEGRQEELLTFQENFFAEVPIECSPNTIISREERIAEQNVTADQITLSARQAAGEQDELYTSIPYVEDGDILITFNSHVLGWRNGHAALVVDAEKGLTLEARVLGSDTTVMSMEHWTHYPSFAVLRLKDATKEERKEIADLAETQMAGVPYHLTAGWGDWIYSVLDNGKSQTPEEKSNAQDDNVEIVVGTQCAHLVWYAYEQFGYDLDSDGGLVVTPHDLYKSPLLEVIQVYGMPISP